MIKLDMPNGYYIFKLDDILKEKNISINKLMRDTNTDFKVLKRLISGDLVRIDIFVISRLCDYFNCSITDIIEYIPNMRRNKNMNYHKFNGKINIISELISNERQKQKLKY